MFSNDIKDGDDREKVQLVIYLQNFPQNVKDVEAMLRYGLERLHGIFMIEEIFNREFDSDDEEQLRQQPVVSS